MRITNSMMNSKFLSEANKALNRVDKYQSQVNSTKR
ncbi:MAG: flagellar hook-associated protein FlgL, partial [Clostridiales bacterium]|nr:flagellar hook-associated protein FlgL [Clostridiales bacterium]